MYINDLLVEGNEFAYEGCHKIYIIEDEADKKEAISFGYSILPIADIRKTYDTSCGLRFIKNWKMTKLYAPQCQDAMFRA